MNQSMAVMNCFHSKKRVLPAGWILFCLLVILTQESLFAQSAMITVEVSGFKKMKGWLSAGLYDKADGFPKRGEAIQGIQIDVTGDPVRATFKGLPSGDYALAIFHDVNTNGTLDRGLFGIPAEPYAFSNNARAPFGPPSFDKAKFSLKDSVTVKIHF